MKKYLFSIVICIFLSPVVLLAMTTSERKKNLEKRTRQLDVIQEVFANQKLSEIVFKLHEKMQDLETAAGMGKQKEILSSLEFAENFAWLAEEETVSIMKEKSKQLLGIFESVKNKPHQGMHKGEMDTVHQEKNPAKDEKIHRYFKMAKAEYFNAEKYQRDKNYFYAVHFYKRSVMYSLKGIEETGNAVSEEFSRAGDWIHKKK